MPSLSAIIRDSGLTLSELHRRSGVGRTTLSRITNGRQAISRPTADKLAPILGMSAEELMQVPSTRPAAPEVLRITALRLKQWGETRRAEEELPGLVSRLIPNRAVCRRLHPGAQRRADHRARPGHRRGQPGAGNPAHPGRTVSLGGKHTRGCTEEGDRGFEPAWPADRMAAGGHLLRFRDDTVLAGCEGVGVSAAGQASLAIHHGPRRNGSAGLDRGISRGPALAHAPDGAEARRLPVAACRGPGLELGGGPSSGDRTAQVECGPAFHRVARVAPVAAPRPPHDHRGIEGRSPPLRPGPESSTALPKPPELPSKGSA